MSRDFLFDPDVTPFDPNANDITHDNALLLAAASNLAYEDEPVCSNATKEWGFDKFKFINSKDTENTEKLKNDTQGFVAANNESILIAFRGTENLKDWKTNLKIKSVKVDMGEVHRGFHSAAQQAWSDTIKLALEEFRTNQQPIWITGHSLGGALALMTAAMLQFEQSSDLNPHAVYTFGQPRIGNREFAGKCNQAFGNRAYRFVHNNDIVPHVPPIGFLFNYWHTEKSYYIDANGKFYSDIPFFIKLFKGAEGVVRDIGNPGPDAVNDHNMNKYISRVREKFFP